MPSASPAVRAPSPTSSALRASVRWLRHQGRTAEARELLAPICASFTEGFDTGDLVEAKALLEELRLIPGRFVFSGLWQIKYRISQLRLGTARALGLSNYRGEAFLECAGEAVRDLDRRNPFSALHHADVHGVNARRLGKPLLGHLDLKPAPPNRPGEG